MEYKMVPRDKGRKRECVCVCGWVCAKDKTNLNVFPTFDTTFFQIETSASTQLLDNHQYQITDTTRTFETKFPFNQ